MFFRLQRAAVVKDLCYNIGASNPLRYWSALFVIKWCLRVHFLYQTQ